MRKPHHNVLQDLTLDITIKLADVTVVDVSYLLHNSDSVMVRVSASGAGGRGFDPGPGHTKDFKNGTSGYLAWCSAL